MPNGWHMWTLTACRVSVAKSFTRVHRGRVAAMTATSSNCLRLCIMHRLNAVLGVAFQNMNAR